MSRNYQETQIGQLENTFDFVESISAQLIGQIKRSQFAESCFADASWLHRDDGYVMDVALSIAWKYWK